MPIDKLPARGSIFIVSANAAPWPGANVACPGAALPELAVAKNVIAKAPIVAIAARRVRRNPVCVVFMYPSKRRPRAKLTLHLGLDELFPVGDPSHTTRPGVLSVTGGHC